MSVSVDGLFNNITQYYSILHIESYPFQYSIAYWVVLANQYYLILLSVDGAKYNITSIFTQYDSILPNMTKYYTLIA